MHLPSIIRIGTRKSKLALAQAELVKAALADYWPELAVDGRIAILPYNTSGDKMQEHALSEIGGKGLFTKEIEEALLADEADIAVHSLKDMPTTLPAGLMIGAVLEREDARDAFIAKDYKSFADLPKGAVFGTSSLRRQVQALRVRPDLQIVPFRGNVQTRLDKIAGGAAHATMLAMAGLNRLHMQQVASCILDAETFIPAVGQGAICIECRSDSDAMRAILHILNHAETMTAVTAERALLARLDGSCRTPIAGHAQLKDGMLHLAAMLASTNGEHCWTVREQGSPERAAELGDDAAKQLQSLARAVI